MWDHLGPFCGNPVYGEAVQSVRNPGLQAHDPSMIIKPDDTLSEVWLKPQDEAPLLGLPRRHQKHLSSQDLEEKDCQSLQDKYNNQRI